jgi:DnaJ-class molecular chaperone
MTDGQSTDGSELPTEEKRFETCHGLGAVRDSLDPFGGSRECGECNGTGRSVHTGIEQEAGGDD